MSRAFGLRLALPLLGVVAFVAFWWLVTGVLAPPPSLLGRFRPDRTAEALGGLILQGQLWPHLAASARRVLIGLALSVLIGLPLGLVVGSVPLVARLTGPVFQLIRMVSPLAWTPLAIILLGVGDAPVYFLIAIGGVWPIVLNTASGIAALNPRWLTLGRSLGANRLELLTAVVWPGIRAHVLTGIRLSVGLAWIIVVPAEMLGVDSGLGYFILDTRDRFAYAELAAAILVVGCCGFFLDSLARFALSERARRLPAMGRRVPAVGPAGWSAAGERVR
ncbi:MAG: ABC transporter permease [Dehalococcoidia bacterium]|nr:MAG: ABC transporter permease [Dehalococcoidia bacterium]